jgi:hypothetical protein
MAILCTVSGLVRGPNGEALSGAVIRIDRAIVAGTRSTTYETRTTTDSTGAFSYSVPQGSIIRFASTDISSLQEKRITVPNNVSLNLGVFKADFASEVNARQAVGTPAAASTGLLVSETPGQIVFTLNRFLVTLAKNGTSTGGGGTLMYTFPAGLVLPQGGSSNLTVANAGDASFLASVGTAAAGTDGTLTSTEITFLPSTAATTSSGAGTCKMKSTVTIPTPSTPLDGSSTPVPMYLNACLNADATGKEALYFSGTITYSVIHLGDN